MTDKQGFIPQKNRNDLTSHFSKSVANKKVSVAIDAANLYYASSISKIKIDYFQVAEWFKLNCKSVNLNFYTAFDPEDAKQLEFFAGLEEAGYKVVKKPIKIFEDSKKGNMDIELAVDAVVQQDSYEILILLSGDGDFTYLVSALEKLGKQTIILGIGGFTSYELHQEAGRYFFLNRISHVWRKFSPKNPLALPEDDLQGDADLAFSGERDDQGNYEEGVLISDSVNSINKVVRKSKNEDHYGHDNIPAKLEKTRRKDPSVPNVILPQPEQITANPKPVSRRSKAEQENPEANPSHNLNEADSNFTEAKPAPKLSDRGINKPQSKRQEQYQGQIRNTRTENSGLKELPKLSELEQKIMQLQEDINFFKANLPNQNEIGSQVKNENENRSVSPRNSTKEVIKDATPGIIKEAAKGEVKPKVRLKLSQNSNPSQVKNNYQNSQGTLDKAGQNSRTTNTSAEPKTSLSVPRKPAPRSNPGYNDNSGPRIISE